MTQEEFDKAPLLDQILYDTTGMLASNHKDIAEAMEKYHQAKLKLFDIGDVSVDNVTYIIGIMTKLEIKHKEEFIKLNKLEQHLIELIANIGNEILRDKFLEWQQQRNVCNIVYNEWLAETLMKLALINK